MIENLIRKYDNLSSNDLVTYIDGLNLDGLVKFYLKCSNHLYFKRYNSMNNILELISNKIKEKLNTVSILELIDIYTNIFIDTLNVEDSIESNNNVINVRKTNLEDNFFVQYESSKKNLSREEFIDSYVKTIDYYEQNSLYLKTVFSFIDNLQKEISDYIDSVLEKISDDDKHALLIKINEIIDENALEIIERNEIKKSRKTIDIHSKMREISTFEIFNMLDTTNLKHKNYVYNNFKAYLEKYNYSNKK